MATHSSLTGADLHEPKGVASAAANQVYVADGAGSGTWTNVQGGNTVIVESANDLPAASGGVRTLAADTRYLIAGDINIGSDRIVFSNNSILHGYGTTISTITSTTTGNLFTASTNFRVHELAVTCASGTVFACTGGAFEDCFLYEFTINSCSSVGSFTNWYSLFWQKGAVVSATTGLIMAGTCNSFILDLVSFLAGYGTAVDLGVATFNTCSFNRCGFSNASATAHIDIAANSANINAGYEGRINFCTFNASATNVVLNSTKGDIRWESFGNLNHPNSRKAAQGYNHTSATTTIGVGDGDSGNPKVTNNNTDFVSAIADQFTISNAGRFTYNGITDAEFLVNVSVIGTSASGTQTYAFYVAKNGTVVTASKTEREFTSTAVGSPAPAMAIVNLSTNDYLEVFIENETGTNDFDMTILNVEIGEA